MEALREYLLCLVSASLLCAIAGAVTPEGTVKKVVLLCGGLVMTVCLLQPLKQVEFSDLARAISQVQLRYTQNAAGISTVSTDIQAQIISEQAAAYIHTKAQELGLALEVQVETRMDGLYPYPWAVTLTGAVPSGQKEVLEQYIEANLAIPPERQSWVTG